MTLKLRALLRAAGRTARPAVRSAARAGAALLLAWAPLTSSSAVPGSPAVTQLTIDIVRKNGMLRLTRGDILGGVHILDSLRLSGLNSEDFLRDYARGLFKALVPDKEWDAGLFSPAGSVSTVADTAPPSSLLWNVVTPRSPTGVLPSFAYGATFTVRKPAPLLFSGLLPGSAPQLAQPQSPLQSDVTRPLVSRFTQRETRVRCTIYIDLTDTKTSLNEYLSSRLSGPFDSVDVRPDLRRYHAVSLRCYDHWYVPGREGRYYAYVSFDRRLGELCRPRPDAPALAKRESAQKVRFTVAVDAGLEVQELAEAKLQSIIRNF